MKMATIAEVTKSLQAIANQKGAKGYEVAKNLYLEGVMIVDDEGNPVDPAAITYDVTISAAPAEAAADAGEAKSASEAIAKAVRAEVAAIRADNPPARKSVVAPTAKVYSRLKHFRSNDEAYSFGTWAFAAMGHQKSASWCAENGIVLKGASEGVNSAGGYLVPEQFENTLISLRETFGVARANANIVPMTGDLVKIPRRTGTLTAYFVGENTAGTESQQTFDQVQLVAKDAMSLSRLSNQLNEDAVINFADALAGEMAYAQASLEDGCAFLGDGTSTYGGIYGLANAVGSAGVSTATSTAFTSITLAQIQAMMALLPQYADNSNAKFYMSKAVWNAVFLRLASVAGGNTQTDLLTGDKKLSFLGYPVVLSQKMNATTGNGAIVCHFGDFSQACYLGDRRQTAVEFSNSALNAFEKNQLVARAVTRWDFVAANVGDSSTAGSIVTLKAGA